MKTDISIMPTVSAMPILPTHATLWRLAHVILYKLHGPHTMKPCLLVLLVLPCTGCTMLSLQRHTLAQANTTPDLRYQEIVDNLAMIAADPSVLPSYSSIFAGSVSVQDQGQLISMTKWPFHVGSQAANPIVNRQIYGTWTLDPVEVPEKLDAMRAACQWAIGGAGHVYPASMSLLIRPDEAPPGPERHFGVADRLAKLPPAWLCTGRHLDVPKTALYTSHCGDTWVWVNPEGLAGLTAFALIIQDIARISINSQTLFNFPHPYAPIQFLAADQDPRGLFKVTVQLTVDQNGNPVTELPYDPLRQDTEGLNADLKAAIGAAAAAVPR